jgi:8-oxo-dGTP diphosphatase
MRLVQVREKKLDDDALIALAERASALAAKVGGSVLLNAEPALAARASVQGVHLTAARLLASSTRPDFEWVGASCHDARELAHAVALDLDFVVLGPVIDTPTHPGARTLGWEGFAALAADCPLPVYALGGLGRADMHDAWRAGAHGIAAIRGAWEG